MVYIDTASLLNAASTLGTAEPPQYTEYSNLLGSFTQA